MNANAAAIPDRTETRNRAYLFFVVLTLVATAVLVYGPFVGISGYARILKMTAATGFIGAALSLGAASWTYGRIMLAGLVLSWCGDLALTYSGDAAFLTGLVSFLLAHLLYCIAFLWRGVKWSWVARDLLPVIGVAGFVLAWLLPYVPNEMRIPVIVYTMVISTMVLLADGARGAGGPITIFIGAILFYLSDISVASGQFVKPDFPNYLWGLPFYFVGQLFLATSTRGEPARQRITSGPHVAKSAS